MSAHNVRTMSARCRHNVRTIFFGFQLWQYLLSIWAVKAGASTILSVKLTSFSLKTTWVLRNFPTTYKIIIKNSSSIPFFLYLNFINGVKMDILCTWERTDGHRQSLYSKYLSLPHFEGVCSPQYCSKHGKILMYSSSGISIVYINLYLWYRYITHL